MNGADSYFWQEDPLPTPFEERIPGMFFIGVDPGVAGGIAVIDDSGHHVATHKMPETRRDLLDILQPFNQAVCQGRPARCMVEKVHAGVFGRPGARMGVVSAFTFGRNVERVHMALVAAGVPYDEVLPAKWQLALGCRTGGDKNISKARAQELFPGLKVTHAIADALLIAEFCRRTERGSISAPASRGLFDGKEEGRAEEGREEERAEEGRTEVAASGRKAGRHTAPPAARAVAGRRGRSR